jgi:hypothetical protein
MWYNGDPEQTVYEKNRNKKICTTQKARRQEAGSTESRA